MILTEINKTVMTKKFITECHDCATSILIVDKFEEIEADRLLFCVVCGSENIEVTEKE